MHARGPGVREFYSRERNRNGTETRSLALGCRLDWLLLHGLRAHLLTEIEITIAKLGVVQAFGKGGIGQPPQDNRLQCPSCTLHMTS